jgi:flagellar hook protein FlgE
MFSLPLAGLSAASQQLSAISNNLANAGTTGFKKSSANFADMMTSDAATVIDSSVGKGVSTLGMVRNTQQGSMEQTSSSLDVAIQGEGYMVFSTVPANQSTGTGASSSNIAYSRAGHLTLNADGYLVDDGGAPVMGNAALPGTTLQNPNLQPINVLKAVGNDPSKVGSITISPNGLVSVMSPSGGNAIPVSYVAIARFENENGLQAMGGNKFLPGTNSGAPQFGGGGNDAFGTFAQGNLENSNVSVTSELLNMISAQQAYNANSRALQTGSDMLKSLTDQVT